MILAFRAFPGKHGPRWLAFSPFSLSFFACQSAFNGRPILFHGVRNKEMETGHARRTFRGRTRRTCSRKCARLTPTSRSAIASARGNNGAALRGA